MREYNDYDRDNMPIEEPEMNLDATSADEVFEDQGDDTFMLEEDEEMRMYEPSMYDDDMRIFEPGVYDEENRDF